MLIKINNKPIRVVEEDEEQKDFSIVYFTVSSVGYLLVLWIMDYVCYTFFYVHPLPFVSAFFHWLGVVWQWFV
jgi:hypothetical protein